MPTQALEERFRGSALDQDVWLPHYLPAWSSRAHGRALPGGRRRTHAGRAARPRVWWPDDHTPPLRVSGVQSGNWSGPLGSTLGQQHFRARPDGARGAGALRGVAPRRRARGDLGPGWALAPLDGRAVDVRVRGRHGPGAVWRALRLRDLRQGARPSRTRRPRSVSASRRSATRRSPRTSRRHGCRSTSSSRTSTRSSGTRARQCSPSTTRCYAAAPARRRTRCS